MQLKDYVEMVIASLPDNTLIDITVKVEVTPSSIKVCDWGIHSISFTVSKQGAL